MGAVTIMVPAEEGATFFLDCDGGDMSTEEWVSDINSYFAEKPKAPLKDVLDFMAKTLPSKLRSTGASSLDEEEPAILDEPEVDEVAIQDIDVLSEERQAKRQALLEE